MSSSEDDERNASATEQAEVDTPCTLPKKHPRADAFSSDEENEAPRKLPRLSSNERPAELKRAASSLSDEEEDERPKKKARRPKKKRLASASSSDEDNEEESDDDEEADDQKTKKARRPGLLKHELAELVRKGDAEALKKRGLNDRKEPRHVLRLKHDVLMCPGGVTLRGLTTVSLAIYYVFLAASREDMERTTAALETLRVLVNDCGLDVSSMEPREKLLEFISTGAEQAVGGTFKEAHVEVLKTLMAHGFLSGRKAIVSAARRFTEDSRVELLCALLRKRARVLDDVQTFVVARMVMLEGSRMVRAVLEVLRARGKLTPELCHEATGSTLLHFAAKYKAGKHIEAVMPYSDAKLTDHKGRTALYFLEREEARGVVVPAERMALLRMATTTN